MLFMVCLSHMDINKHTLDDKQDVWLFSNNRRVNEAHLSLSLGASLQGTESHLNSRSPKPDRFVLCFASQRLKQGSLMPLATQISAEPNNCPTKQQNWAAFFKVNPVLLSTGL